MPIHDPRRRIITTRKKGIKRVDRTHCYHDFLPQDGRVVFDTVDAEIDTSGKVVVVEKRNVYLAHCFCYVESPEDLGGRCVRGLMVCRRHFENCPINSRQPSFDWENTERIRPCLIRCRIVIGLMRFFHWLVTPPKVSMQD